MKNLILPVLLVFSLWNDAFASDKQECTFGENDQAICEFSATIKKHTRLPRILDEGGHTYKHQSLYEIEFASGPEKCRQLVEQSNQFIAELPRWKVGEKKYRFAFMFDPKKEQPYLLPRVEVVCQSEWINGELVVATLTPVEQTPTTPGFFTDIVIQHALDRSWSSSKDYEERNLHLEQIKDDISPYGFLYKTEMHDVKLSAFPSSDRSGIAYINVELPSRQEPVRLNCRIEELWL